MLKNKFSKYFIALSMGAAGLVVGVAGIAFAQSPASSSTSTANTTTTALSNQNENPTVDTPEPGDVADVTDSPKKHGHAPLGGDGIVSSVSGTTIVMGEEGDEGGASYNIDASKATISVNGANGTLGDIKVGQKIFVQGTTSGTNIIATTVSIGHPGGQMEREGEKDQGSENEADEPAGSSDVSKK